MGLRMMGKKFQKIVYEQTLQRAPLSYKGASAVFIIFFVSIRVLADILIQAVPGAYRNYGTAFSLPAGGVIQWSVVVCGLSGVAYILLYCQKTSYFTPMMLILAAGASNVFERLRYGAVIDPLVIWNWYGNGADIAIGIGIIWIICGMMRNKNIL